MATRRTAEGLRFDHGAQYFTVRDERFGRYVRCWVQAGIVASWDGAIATLGNGRREWKQKTTLRYVGVPGMNAICRHLASDLHVVFGTQVAPPEFEEGGWRTRDHQGQQYGPFDYFISSAPGPQTAHLLTAAPDLQRLANGASMHGCWAALLAFDRSLELPFDGAFVHGCPLSWIARNSSKPDRDGNHESWVVHAAPEWTTHCLDEDPDAVLPQLVSAFWQATGASPRTPIYAASHRWRYATVPQPLESPCLFDPRRRIGACGDWCGGPRVEGAWLSGMAMAGRLLMEIPAISE
jgi:predicted NAD/FAD-dependent oxidoreductase